MFYKNHSGSSIEERLKGANTEREIITSHLGKIPEGMEIKNSGKNEIY